MAKFLVGDGDSNEEVEAVDIAAAVEANVRDHSTEYSDAFEVHARGVDDKRWRIFSVTTRTEFIVNIGRARDGGEVEVEVDDE
jgi:hypothetical protein